MYRITIDEAVYITVSFFFPDVHKYAFSDGSMNFRTGGAQYKSWGFEIALMPLCTYPMLL